MTTRRRLSVGARLAVIAGLVLLTVWPMSSATADKATSKGAETTKVGSLAESWYTKLQLPTIPGLPLPELPELPEIDLCSLPIGCPELPELPIPLPLPTDLPTDLGDLPGLAFPKGTLHVALTAGRPVARSFIVPDLTQLPEGAELVSGQLVLPLSEDPTSGNVAAETAAFGACLTTTEVTDGATGRLAGAPEFDCQAAAAKAVYREKTNDFVIDLAPFIEQWKAGVLNYGVALVPTTSGEIAVDTFHVTINGSRVTTGTPSSSTLRYDVAGTTEPEPTETATTEAPTTDPGIEVPPVDTGGGIVTPDPPVADDAPPAPEAPTEAAPSAAEPLQAAPVALLNNPWYTYRGVVFLPLAFLVALSLTGRSLTRPLAGAARPRRV